VVAASPPDVIESRERASSFPPLIQASHNPREARLTVTDAPVVEPMDLARQLVELSSQRDDYAAHVASLDERIKAIKEIILTLVEDGRLPESFRCDGKNVHLHRQVWAGPINGDHKALAAVLAELGLIEYLPSTVNSQKISAFVREHIDPDNKHLELRDRLLSAEPVAIDPRLLDVLKITEKRDIRVTA
jgi:hypothetical protein